VQQLTRPVLFNKRATIYNHLSGIQGNFFQQCTCRIHYCNKVALTR
jgi:hypothetical protein